MPQARPEPDRPRVGMAGGIGAVVMRIAPAALAVLGLAALLLVALGGSASVGRGYDFQAYWDAGARLLAGGSLYDPGTLAGPFRPGPKGLYLYPPPLGVALLPLQALPFEAADTLWVWARLGMLAGACALLPVSRRVRLAVLGTTALASPALVDLNLGNVSIVVMALAAMGWRWLDKPSGSMAVAAAIALRSPMAILLAWQALRRAWRPLAWTLGAGVAMLVLTLPVVGTTGYSDYLRVLRNLSDITGVTGNVDLSSTAVRVGIPAALAPLALMGGYLVALGAVWLGSRRDREIGYVVAVGSTLLLTPLLWDHYLVLLALPAALLAARGWPSAVMLPLLGWLPDVALPLAAVVATLLPLVLPDRLGSRTPMRPARSPAPA